MIRRASINDILPLRQRVLRPTFSISDSMFEEDDEYYGIHFGHYINDLLVACLSVYRQKQNLNASQKHWRLRGMAVDERFRGQGLGRELLHKAMNELKQRKASSLWCNARASAMQFYLKNGFKVIGDAFMIHRAGEHYRMVYQFTP